MRTSEAIMLVSSTLFITHQALAAEAPRDIAARLVTQIQRADFEGHRARLAALAEQLPAADGDAHFASRIHYWRGFALWRRAVNGFNENAPADEQERDSNQAIEEFRQANLADSTWIEPRVGAISCLGILLGLHQKEPERMGALIGSLIQLSRQAAAMDRDSPRLLWVQGPGLWFTPLEQGGGQTRAITTYHRGLELSRERGAGKRDVLEPIWGEPELLMSLAWSNLNRTMPDLAAAERYARQALRLVPHWHYVRDILLPQIEKARRATR